MKKIDVGQTIGILANVGVIAGIMFLAFELRQNNELMAADARFNRLVIAKDQLNSFYENPELADLLSRSGNGEELTEPERARIRAFFRSLFLNHEWSYREIPVEELPLSTWKRGATGDRKANWEMMKSDFNPEFVRFMDDNVYN